MKIMPRFRAGDWAEVLSRDEILRTLDKRGTIDNLPFMPEMLQYSGQRFKVFKNAYKTCDPPSGLKARRMDRAVHLEGVRCDGQAHGGCQAACLIFWKDVWLKKSRHDKGSAADCAGKLSTEFGKKDEATRCTEADLIASCLRPENPADRDNPRYACQSTELRSATVLLAWWDPRQYVETLRSGNARLSELLGAFVQFLYSHLAESGIGLGSGMRWFYNSIQNVHGRGGPYPWRNGKVTKGEATPASKLNLQPGELVRVKSYSDILETLDGNMNNRGLYFDLEMVPFTDNVYRVLKRVEKIIDEKTGKMMMLKSDAVILENVFCLAHYSKYRRFCSRSIFCYWREIWLDRVEQNDISVLDESRDKR